MILFLARDRQSYFQSYKTYFTAIYFAFLGFPAADLVIITFPNPTLLRLATQVLVTSGTAIAIIWGYVATKLYTYPETLSLRRMVSRPFRFIFFAYALYVVPMLLAGFIAWLEPDAISTGPSFYVTYVLERVTLPSAPVGPVLLGLGGVIVAVFALYPLTILSKRSALVKDKDVRAALRIIATAFGVISATLILGIGLSSFGYGVTGVTDFISVVLIIVAVNAFRRPTFLKSFLGVVPSLQSSPTASRFDQVIMLHGPGDDKYVPIGKYIDDGVAQHERIIYFHDGDMDLIKDGLSRQGLDVTRLMLKGVLRVSPLGSAYPSRAIVDDTAIEAVRELANEAKMLGNEGLRVIFDYDDFVVHPLQRFVKHLTDPRWTSSDHRVHVLMVFDSSAFRGEEGSLAELESRIRTLDLSESTDTFSRTVGLEHKEVAGRKLLLEFDPQWEYESVFKSLLAETASNFERTVIFTRRESAVYSLAQRQPAAKIFVLTSRVSYPKMEGENLVLLPAYDSSLLLDSLNKTIDAYSGSSFTIIFDNISHFVFTIGAERTYSLIRQALELMVSDKITAIFCINYKAHDQKTLSTFENMFDIDIIGQIGRNLEVRKKITALN